MIDIFSNKPTIKRKEIVDTEPKLKRLSALLRMVQEFAYDCETNTLRVYGPNKDFKLVGISISWGEYNNYYIPLNHAREEDLDRQLDQDLVVRYLKTPFERKDVRIIGQNLKFDMHSLYRVGIDIQTEDLFDTMIASWLCDENSQNGLKENSKRLLKVSQDHFADTLKTVPNEVKKQFGLKASNKATFDLVLIDDGAPYALEDAFFTWELYLGFIIQLDFENMWNVYTKVYAPFTRTLYNMEKRGVAVDREQLAEMDKEIITDMEDLQYQMYELAGVEFNPSSSQHIYELLFGYQKLNSKGEIGNVNENILACSFNFPITDRTPSGVPQTGTNVLWQLANAKYKNKRKQEGVEVCRLISEYKKLDKLRSAFITGLDSQIYDDGKVHPTFNIIGTDSGRISCSKPNLQQLPNADDSDKYQIRKLFIGDINPETNKRNKIIALDFSNLEMRVLAHFSEDKNLLDMFEHGHDTHGSTAVNMFELDCTASEVKKQYPHLRQAAKILNFLLMYGGGAFTLYNSLRLDRYNPIDLGDESYLKAYHAKNGEEVAQAYIDKYFNTYSGVSSFINRQKRSARRNGYVYTLLRRKRRLPHINSDDFKMKAYNERLAVNSCVQGSAADITMSAQNLVANDPWFNEHGIHMIIQVHDELVIECPEEYVEETIERVKYYMEHPFGENVKLNVDLIADAGSGDNYQQAK